MTRSATLRRIAEEGSRYVAAAAVALVLDIVIYLALIRVLAVSYLTAAPVAFAAGLATIYVLSVRWVFVERRFANARVEFALFALIGLAGMGLNQLVVYGGVEHLALSPEAAKLVSVAVVFGFNFGMRKGVLFRR